MERNAVIASTTLEQLTLIAHIEGFSSSNQYAHRAAARTNFIMDALHNSISTWTVYENQCSAYIQFVGPAIEVESLSLKRFGKLKVEAIAGDIPGGIILFS